MKQSTKDNLWMILIMLGVLNVLIIIILIIPYRIKENTDAIESVHSEVHDLKDQMYEYEVVRRFPEMLKCEGNVECSISKVGTYLPEKCHCTKQSVIIDSLPNDIEMQLFTTTTRADICNPLANCTQSNNTLTCLIKPQCFIF
jgi:hypothetical protein